MPRKLRFAPPGFWLHLTQRGNNQQTVFSTQADRHHFLGLLKQHSEEREVRIAGYSLMPNHFHLVAVGDRPNAISLFMMQVNGQYATYRNTTHCTTGRIWQNRFYSCVLDTHHWETALRYVELNPVRARLVTAPQDHAWSSARAHLGLAPAPAWLDTEQFHRHWPSPEHWRQSLSTLTRREVAALRRATRHDAALGSDDFLDTLERAHEIRLRARPTGRPRKGPSADLASPISQSPKAAGA